MRSGGLAPELRGQGVYSTILHTVEPSRRRGTPKSRATFRLEPDLLDALRALPNQTAFVETTLREALTRLCPVCRGTGQAAGVHLSVSNCKALPIGRLDRATAAQLKTLVRLGRQLLATDLELHASTGDPDLEFRLAREDQVLLSGRIPRGAQAPLRLTH